MMFVHTSLCFVLGLAAAPQSQTISARAGDVVVVNPTAEVRVVRRGEAQVRAIFNAAQRSLILLVDYVGWDGHEPDDRVDVAYRFFDVGGDWPLGARWDGRAIVEDYSLMGGATSSHGAGLRTPAGLVQLLSEMFSPRSAELFAQKPSLATLSYRGGGRGTAGEVTFDLAEAREAELVARTIERRLNPGASSAPSGVTFMIDGVAAGSTSGSPSAYPPPGAPVRVGGNIRTPQRVVDAAPVMPEVARQAGIRGVVILEIVIGVDGRVTDAKILRSIPLLDQAAIDAARQWRYEPTLLNGAPVPVIMTATVSFQ
jgi:TonB family protein